MTIITGPPNEPVLFC